MTHASACQEPYLEDFLLRTQQVTQNVAFGEQPLAIDYHLTLTSHIDHREPSKTHIALHRRNMSSTPRLRSLNIDNINPHVKEAKYAVRGELAIKSEEYRAQLKKGDPPTPPENPLPFDTVISANIGNPQQLDQKPITFFRQVLALLEYPPLLENEQALKDSFGYKQDAIDRARWLLKEVNSVGAYSGSGGAPAIKQSVANYIERRDGFPSDPNGIYLSTGASSGVNTLMHIICAKPETGILVPIPQYPLYTATLSLLNARCVPYLLDEEKAWGTDLSVIRESYDKAIKEGTDVRAIVVINPGNPTGASLSADNVRAVLEFAAEKNLVVLADEVYQTNVFTGKFTSFKKVLSEMQKGNPGNTTPSSWLRCIRFQRAWSANVGIAGVISSLWALTRRYRRRSSSSFLSCFVRR